MDRTLSDAVADRDEAAVEQLLAAGQDPNGAASRVPDGFLPVYHMGEHVPLLVSAALSGHVGIVRRLVDAGAAVDAPVMAQRSYQTHEDSYTVEDGTPLCYAAREGHLQIVRLLLDRGAAIDASDDVGNTPLALAASRGQLATVELLVARGAGLDRANGDRLAPLDHACREGHGAVALALEAAGARSGPREIPWPWALRMAASRGHLADLSFVLRRGGANLDQAALDSALEAAAYFGHADVARELIARGASPREVGAPP